MGFTSIHTQVEPSQCIMQFIFMSLRRILAVGVQFPVYINTNLFSLIYVLITDVCWNEVTIAIYYRQAFIASILRLLHQVYEKMSIYINQVVYLPKVAPFKCGCRVVGVYVVLGVCREFIEIVEGGIGKGKAPLHRIILTKWSCTCPPLYCVIYIWGRAMWGMVGGFTTLLCYLTWRDGVSCNTLSHMCDSWYFPKFLLSDGSLTWM